MDKPTARERTALPPHTWMVMFMALVAVAFMVCGNAWRRAVVPVAWIATAVYAAAEVHAHGIRRSRYNVLLAAAAALYAAVTVVRRDFSAYAWCNLGLCTAAFLIGIVPARFDRGQIRREMYLFGLVTVLAYLPFVILALASVFTARPVYLINAEQAIGIQKLGRPAGRIYVGVHPNYTAQICIHCILFAVYAIRNTSARWPKPLLALAIAAFLLGLSHAQSRSATILLGVAAGALLFRWSWNRFGDRRRGALVGAALVVLSVLAALFLTNAIYSLDVRLARRLNPWIHSNSSGATSRVVTDGALNLTENGRGRIWAAVLRYLRARPRTLLVGRGAGPVFKYIMPYIVNGRNYGYLHNNWLEVVMRGGLPMLLLVCALLVALVRPCARQLLRDPDPGERASCIRPVVILVLVLVMISESMLFAYASFPNVIFFTMCSQVMSLEEPDRAR